MARKRILIAGAGDVGRRLGRRRAANGDAVWLLRRRPIEPDLAGIRTLSADLTSGAGLDHLPSEFDAIVFCAAPDQREEAAYRRLYLDGPARLLDALPTSPERFLITTSTAVYGEDCGEWVDEATPARPREFNGRVLLQAEQALASRLTGALAVRLSGLYGPGRTRMLARARSGDPGTRRWGNRIHVEDAASALDRLLDIDAPLPIYLASDDRPARDCDVLAWLARLQSSRAEDRTHDRTHDRTLDPPPDATSETPPDGPDSGRRVANARLRATGWQPRFPDFRAGYSALLDNTAGPD